MRTLSGWFGFGIVNFAFAANTSLNFAEYAEQNDVLPAYFPETQTAEPFAEETAPEDVHCAFAGAWPGPGHRDPSISSGVSIALACRIVED